MASVFGSKLAVASSRIKIEGLTNSARANAINWRWPEDNLEPLLI